MNDEVAPPEPDQYSEDVHQLQLGQRQIILIGTAHVSQDSAHLVRDVITREQPDCVCIELDQKRYESLSQKKRWEALNLKEVIKKKQLSTLVVNLVLASFSQIP